MGTQGASFPIGRFIHQFRKTGSPGQFTALFKDLPEISQESLKGVADLGAEEVPVIACFFDRTRWTLLTSRRLLWSSQGERHSLALSDLTDATIPSGHLVGAADKLGLSKILVSTVNDDSFEIQLEPGRPFFGFWNVLKLAAR